MIDSKCPVHFTSLIMCIMYHKTFYSLSMQSNKARLSLSMLMMGMMHRMARYGTIRINLEKLLKERGLSKNKLSQRAEMQRTQLNNYCNNTISRLDTDVLGRLCTVLECEIGDLLEFVPPEE